MLRAHTWGFVGSSGSKPVDGHIDAAADGGHGAAQHADTQSPMKSCVAMAPIFSGCSLASFSCSPASLSSAAMPPRVSEPEMKMDSFVKPGCAVFCAKYHSLHK